MRVLLVEPDFRFRSKSFISSVTGPANTKKRDDSSLWYPPIGLLKLATFHKLRNDEVRFVIGCDKTVLSDPDLFTPENLWDRIYITTLFTFNWANIVKTVEFYKKAVGDSSHKIFVGGVMASIIPKDIFEETGIQPITGIISSPKKIGLDGHENIDQLPLDYSVLDGRIYAINDTFYGYTTRGCTNTCPWCGVPSIEPEFCDYIDIKPVIKKMRTLYGDKSRLKLMDNNILASPNLEKIVNDLVELGYGRDQYTSTQPRRKRVVDFNQGLDATHINKKTMRLLEKLNVRPMRIAFDKLGYQEKYERAVRVAHRHGVRDFSNYMLFNEKDTPRDLFERMNVNIDLNSEWRDAEGKASGVIYSYPMRYAPIKDETPLKQNRRRDYIAPTPNGEFDYLAKAIWNKRFIRNIEIIKGAAHGAISPTPSLARRAIGETYEEFIANLYMPEELLRNRNKYEKKVYPHEPPREPGTGDVEKFRHFILGLLKRQDETFLAFHEAVSPCTKGAIREALAADGNAGISGWLEWYLK